MELRSRGRYLVFLANSKANTGKTCIKINTPERDNTHNTKAENQEDTVSFRKTQDWIDNSKFDEQSSEFTYSTNYDDEGISHGIDLNSVTLDNEKINTELTSFDAAFKNCRNDCNSNSYVSNIMSVTKGKYNWENSKQPPPSKKIQILQDLTIYPYKDHDLDGNSSYVSDSVPTSISSRKTFELPRAEEITAILPYVMQSPSKKNINTTEVDCKGISCNETNNLTPETYAFHSDGVDNNSDARDKGLKIFENSRDTSSEVPKNCSFGDMYDVLCETKTIDKPSHKPLSEEIKILPYVMQSPSAKNNNKTKVNLKGISGNEKNNLTADMYEFNSNSVDNSRDKDFTTLQPLSEEIKILPYVMQSPSEKTINKTEVNLKGISGNETNNLTADMYEFNSNSVDDDDSRDKDFKLSECSSDTSSESFKHSAAEDIDDLICEMKTIDKPPLQPLSEEIKILPYVTQSPSEENINKTEVNLKGISGNEKNNLTADMYEFNSNSVDDDDSRDKDFKLLECSSDTSSESSKHSAAEDIDDLICEMKSLGKPPLPPLSEEIKNERGKLKKIIHCQYCTEDIATKNFMRHLQRNHATVKEVEDVFRYPKNSKERKHALAMLRNETNFNLYIKGVIRPNRRCNASSKQLPEDIKYYPCAYCKGLFKKEYLRRHVKTCIPFNTHANANQGSKINHLSRSHTVIACAIDPTNVISQLNVKEQVFELMRGDEIALEVKKDLLIAQFGNSYLKKHRRERMSYVCSNRMRELARLLINYRKIINKEDICLKDLLHPQNFDMVISAVRNISGYDPFKKTFAAPSLAMHLGTTLKCVCDELTHLVLKESNGFKCQSPSECKIWLQNIKNFKKLVESRWNIELASLANKDLNEKRWTKPLLLPLVSDIQKFREETLKIANNCKQLFNSNKDNKNTYKELVQCSLALLIVFNRRRIGDVQFLKIQDYQLDRKTDCTDFEGVLTDTEKMLTTKYKRVINSGKGSRAVVILIPEIIQNFINLLLQNRNKYIPSDNEYVFATPGGRIKWGRGDVAIKTLVNRMHLQNPESFSSNKLRKQIATVMQVMNLSKDDNKQFSDFMGHTQKTHEEFYELPVDIYQTAKVSKVLLLMENGSVPAEYKGKSLSDITFDPNLEYVVENNADDNGIILNSQQNSNKMPQDENLMNEVFDQEKPIQEKDADTDESDEIPKKRVKKSNTTHRKGWTEMEIRLLKDHFQGFIKSETYPSGEAIRAFIKEKEIYRTVPVIKSKLQHLIKLKSKK